MRVCRDHKTEDSPSKGCASGARGGEKVLDSTVGCYSETLDQWFSTGVTLPPRDTEQCLKTFFIVTWGEEGEDAAGIYWAEAKHPTAYL